LVAEIFADSHETYGYRRVHAALLRRGEHCSAELVRALMREQGLIPAQVRAFRPVTTIQGDYRGIPDLVGRDFTAERPGTKLVGDITYIRTWEGFLYLATVIDCHSKAVLGWAMADHYRTELIKDAIRMAAGTGLLQPGAVFRLLRQRDGRIVLQRDQERMAPPLRLHHPSQGKTAGHPLHRRVLQSPAPALGTRLPATPGSTQRVPFNPNSRIGYAHKTAVRNHRGPSPWRCSTGTRAASRGCAH
ncbi:MAG: family transposase, partial [Nonomuraea muscovyensis]|nr:family transposase [Nonomuraea muscovyensis]